MDGKRLVRVNDVVLESNGEIKVMGIDVGTSGIMRRLGLGWLIKLKSKVLPWTIIEAFDYQTGAVKLRLSQNRLDMFHPSEIAEILEQLGSKERLGIVETLDAKKAARAIEELDSQAQVSILEHLPKSPFKDIVNKMHLSEIADIFHRLNRPTSTRVENVLGEEKTTRLQRLFKFSDNVAGGLMETAFFRENGDKTAKELLRTLREKNLRPETVVVTNGNDKLIGIAYSRDLLNADPLEQIRDLVLHRMFVYPFADFPKILKLFSQYNLRALPVVNKEKQPIGVITIDKIMQMIQEEEEEKNEIL
ncbi:CBS domain-containing protein [Patescibacteria group bacterium]|nr:CBS domain-containing protein [Patescibacteria group bacterium]